MVEHIMDLIPARAVIHSAPRTVDCSSLPFLVHDWRSKADTQEARLAGSTGNGRRRDSMKEGVRTVIPRIDADVGRPDRGFRKSQSPAAHARPGRPHDARPRL
jgi:hypothetical protein